MAASVGGPRAESKSERRRSRWVLALVVAAILLGASCEPTKADPGTASGTTADDAAARLGPVNRATGSPIRVGFVTDGRSAGVDATPISDAFNATVRYANEHLGGIDGHVIEVDECSTGNTPAGATTCGVQMVNDGVAAVLVPVSAQDATIWSAISGSGIPYFTYLAAAQDIMLSPGAFLLVNPMATVAAPARIAQRDGVKKAAIIVVDVPAATGPLTAIAQPIYKKAGIDLTIVPVSLQTADMTPQVQQAIAGGAELVSVIGSDEFVGAGIKTLRQLEYPGKTVIVTAPTRSVIDNVPGGLDGVVYVTSATDDPGDHDVQVYEAVMQTYVDGGTLNSQAAWSYALVVAFVDALKGSGAVDAPSVAKALGSMPAPLPLPLGGGLTFHCGAKVVALLPNSCTDDALTTTLDAEGRGHGYETVDVSSYLTLGG